MGDLETYSDILDATTPKDAKVVVVVVVVLIKMFVALPDAR
jgi:hypothetical protein